MEGSQHLEVVPLTADDAQCQREGDVMHDFQTWALGLKQYSDGLLKSGSGEAGRE